MNNIRKVSMSPAGEDGVIHTGNLGPVIMVETVKDDEDNPRVVKTSLDDEPPIKPMRRESHKTRPSVSNISLRSMDSYVRKKSSAFARRASVMVQSVRKQSMVVVLSAWKSFRGIFYASLCALFFAVDATIVKGLSRIDPAFIALIQFLEIGLFSIIALSSTSENAFGPPEDRFWLILRGLTGALTWYLRYKSIHYLPLANAITISLSYLIFVCIFARIFLKEPFKTFHLIAVSVTVVGIGFTVKIDQIFWSLISDEEADDEHKQKGLGLLCGLSGAITCSLSIIVLRRLRNINHTVVLFNLSWVSSIFMICVTYSTSSFKLPECGYDPWLLVLLGVFSFFGQMMLTKALQYEEASTISVTRAALDIILAFILQITVFEHAPDAATFIGAFLVSSAVVLVNLRKYILTLPLDHYLRHWFAFIIE